MRTTGPTRMGHFDSSTKDLVHLSAVVSLLLLIASLVSAGTFNNINDTVPYLANYGYIPSVGDNQVVDRQVLLDGLGRLQDMCGVSRTGGIIDEATSECLNRPRCGNPDFVTGQRVRRHSGGRKRRYYIPAEADSWSPQSTHITYDIVVYSDDLPPSVIDDSIRRAFEVWSNATVLSFERIRGGQVDISISFYPTMQDHGDNMPFDGPGTVLAHAFWPWSEDRLKMDVHFDEAETWTAKSYSGANLWLVAAHEIGHTLGLGHNFILGTLMFPIHFGYNPDFVLHSDDIAGISELYGDIAPTPGPTVQDTPDLCQVVIDAVMVDGFTYFFKGEYYWKVLNGQPEPGYPRRISERWPGLEGGIDAAITVKNDFVWTPHTGKTYFFKARRVWRYTLTRLDEGFPKDADQEFPGFPSEINKIKGIFEISGNGETYIFTDGGFYVYNWLGFQGPYALQVFGGIPNNIVGAVQWTDNYIYFFTDNFQYYQCSPWSFSISRGYPRLAHVDWIGCPANSPSAGNLRLVETSDSLPESSGHDLEDTGSHGSSVSVTRTWTSMAILLGLLLLV
ncbi:72 kDa type IV collagenase-like [Patiria miniata]|uniref:Peptidase metallopeptidase domain-containing protein n=1 Tax=Patiria miniata TaxID=46514 RepID=A0A914A7B1_PATMI|nr:72 kDa type IV collagenase-like [Patiria miniata]